MRDCECFFRSTTLVKALTLGSSARREQWAKAFPLVRGLAGIWSDQPWFLDVYAKYILSLEEALATIDSCLPSTVSFSLPPRSSSSAC